MLLAESSQSVTHLHYCINQPNTPPSVPPSLPSLFHLADGLLSPLNREICVGPWGEMGNEQGPWELPSAWKQATAPKQGHRVEYAIKHVHRHSALFEGHRCPPRAGQTNTQMPRSSEGPWRGLRVSGGQIFSQRKGSNYEGASFILWFLSFFFSMVILDV